ncbi:hypothetical protein BGW37DRAFT_485813 [Umbelopsis sp. PMI_123]|nr:hypothetical protein BGW37DRAFT_485813 [Umbelopsis sp. PMI_123]
MKSIAAAIAFFAIAAVSAQTNMLSITSPLAGTVYTAGQNAVAAWTINPAVSTISQIVLVQGPATALQPVVIIGTTVDASFGQWPWSIPQATAPGTDYALEFGASPNISYSGFFTIQAATGTAAAYSAPASTSVADSSAIVTASAVSNSAVATPDVTPDATTDATAASTVAAGSSAASSAPAATTSSGSGVLKTGVFGAGLAAGVAVLLL